MSNAIVTENQLPGSPAIEWDINGWGDPSIQGFGHDISIDRGQTIDFRIATDATAYRIDIYRMGYYGGLGARRVDTIRPSVKLPQVQPDGLRDPQTHLYDCGNWLVSASWTAPVTAVSGIYFARLVREDEAPARWRADHSPVAPSTAPMAVAHAYGALGHGRLRNALLEPRASHIYFIVRDDAGHADILFQTADTTWQAYNRYGGHCTYGRLDPDHPRQHGGPPRAYKVSYNRPFETRHYRAVNMPFHAEYPCVRFLEANGFDVAYTTGLDSDRRGELIRHHRLFLSVGHDEYWSADQRRHVEAARDAGVHLAFFSGNEVFWKTRWEPGLVDREDAHRTLVTYKETHDNRKIDPVADVWTGTWRDSNPENPEGAQPENALTGTIFTVNAWRNDPIIVPADYARLRFWRHTAVARLMPGEQAVLLKGLLGHEWDEDIDNGFRPPGLFRLSETTIDNVPYVQDCGSVYDSGTATHHLTLYRHASGALVFGAGTVQWAWGLDAHHDSETGMPPERQNENTTRVGIDPHGPDPAVRQATVNLFADMGIQPAQLAPDLIRARASDDHEPPVSVITSPLSGATVARGPLRISGQAHDVGGGLVAGVEVSLDAGHTWHPAVGRESWFYDCLPSHAGVLNLRCRAVDDSGNLEAAGEGVSVTVV